MLGNLDAAGVGWYREDRGTLSTQAKLDSKVRRGSVNLI